MLVKEEAKQEISAAAQQHRHLQTCQERTEGENSYSLADGSRDRRIRAGREVR